MKKPANFSSKALLVLGLAFISMLLFSCISFDVGDFPSKFVWPNNHPAANWCGACGAFLAYYLMYYAGPGIFIALVAIASAIIVKLADKQVTQPFLRTIGLVLVTASISAIIYMLRRESVSSLPTGSGGILGAATVIFLKKNFSLLGTVIIVLSGFIVGAILFADSLVMGLLHVIGAVCMKFISACVPAWATARVHSQKVSEIWKRLSEKKPEPQATIEELIAEEAQQVHEMQQQSPQQTVQADREIEHHLQNEPAPAALAIRQPVKAKAPVHDTTEEKEAYEASSYDGYILPPLDLLIEPEYNFGEVQEKIIKAKSSALEQVLNEFNIEAHVVGADPGPTITMFELSLAPGIKVSQITNLSNDVARALGAPAVRVVAPLPGRHTIGIEVPNSQKETVRLKDLIVRADENYKKMNLPLFLGKDSSGRAIVSDLAAMPHLLIAGTTGSGKSVCINSIIMSLMLTKRPDEVKLVLVDPQMVEMTALSKVPHLMAPIVTEINKAEQIFEWATIKMDERYALFAEAGVKNIAGYNSLGTEELIKRFNPQTPDEEAKIPKKVPYFVIIVDELADLMMTSSKEIESYIVRIAQKSRAVGIHIVLATQRPQATVVTGLIKANLPSRISFRVSGRLDSRIVLDQNGAETLLGQGDMLFLKPGSSDLVRAQGAYVDDGEVKKVVQHLAEQAEPQFHPELVQLNRVDAAGACDDEMFDDAVRIVLESQRGSVSLLQRKLSIGYARASRIIEAMASSGILGSYKGSQARECMMTLEDYENARKQMAIDKQAGFSDMQEPVEVIEEVQEDETEGEDDGDEEETPDDKSESSHDIKDADYDYNHRHQHEDVLNS
ncbi:MAG: DNA translocase FtsK 4TM domain-containing protein [Phycisphaerales bacterium]